MKAPPAERYAEGLAAIDAGCGPDWAPELAEAIRLGELPIHFADRTGRSRSYAYQILTDPHGVKARQRKGTYICERCRREKQHDGTRQRPTHCITCAGAIAGERARERVLTALREWAELYGRPPSATDWNPSAWGHYSPERRALMEDRHSARKWPHLSGVQTLFGSWNEAIEAAGFDPVKPGERRDPESWQRALKQRGHRKMSRTAEAIIEREIEKVEQAIEKTAEKLADERQRLAKLRKAREALAA